MNNIQKIKGGVMEVKNLIYFLKTEVTSKTSLFEIKGNLRRIDNKINQVLDFIDKLEKGKGGGDE